MFSRNSSNVARHGRQHNDEEPLAADEDVIRRQEPGSRGGILNLTDTARVAEFRQQETVRTTVISHSEDCT